MLSDYNASGRNYQEEPANHKGILYLGPVHFRITGKWFEVVAHAQQATYRDSTDFNVLQ